MEKVKLGLIGFGNIGSAHARLIFDGKTPEIELTAIADLLPERREAAAKLFDGKVTLFESGDELIQSATCEAVLIAVPHYAHPTLSIAAFQKGLHVLCEKPAGVYTKQVREMNAAALRSNVIFAMMFNQRTNCVYRKMHQLVTSGELGAIKRVNWIITDWYRTQAYYNSGGWRATWNGEGGGVLVNQCPHNLDLLQWICGMPIRVKAFCHEGKWHDIEVEDDVTAYLEYPNGATGVFVTSTADAPGTNRLEITLEYGKLISEYDKLLLYRLEKSEREYCYSSPEGFKTPNYTLEEIKTDGQNPQHMGVINAFASAILHGTPLVAGGAEGINGLSISNAMHLSSWLNQIVEIPFDEDLFLTELNKRRAASVNKTGTDVVFKTEDTY